MMERLPLRSNFMAVELCSGPFCLAGRVLANTRLPYILLGIFFVFIVEFAPYGWGRALYAAIADRRGASRPPLKLFPVSCFFSFEGGQACCGGTRRYTAD